MAVTHVKRHVQSINRNRTLYRHAAYRGLECFFGQLTYTDVSRRYAAKPFLSQPDCFVKRNMSCHSKNRVIRRIKAEKKIFHFLKCGIRYMANLFPDGGPAVRMSLIRHFPKQMGSISVGLVQVSLLKLFDNYLTLYLQTAGREIKTQHTVAFQPKTCFHILVRQGYIIIRNVVVRPCVILASCILHGRIIIGHVYRATEHQVLKQMGKACMCRVFIAGTYIVKYVQSNHLCRVIFIMYDAQSVGKRMSVYLNHFSNTSALSIRIFVTGRSARPVFAFPILSTTSMPSVTSPNTV